MMYLNIAMFAWKETKLNSSWEVQSIHWWPLSSLWISNSKREAHISREHLYNYIVIQALFVEVLKEMKVLRICPGLYETFQHDSLVLCACIYCNSLTFNKCTLAPCVIYGHIKFQVDNVYGNCKHEYILIILVTKLWRLNFDRNGRWGFPSKSIQVPQLTWKSKPDQKWLLGNLTDPKHSKCNWANVSPSSCLRPIQIFVWLQRGAVIKWLQNWTSFYICISKIWISCHLYQKVCLTQHQSRGSPQPSSEWSNPLCQHSPQHSTHTVQ